MKKYEKLNQVYTVQEDQVFTGQEGSELEVQLIADGFKELVEDGGELETPTETKIKGKE